MSETANTEFLLRWRMLKDHIARHAVGIGGISVIIAIILIFVYLLYVVIPMFEGAEIRNLGDVRWCAIEDGTQGKGTGRWVAAFILK